MVYGRYNELVNGDFHGYNWGPHPVEIYISYHSYRGFIPTYYDCTLLPEKTAPTAGPSNPWKPSICLVVCWTFFHGFHCSILQNSLQWTILIFDTPNRWLEQWLVGNTWHILGILQLSESQTWHLSLAPAAYRCSSSRRPHDGLTFVQKTTWYRCKLSLKTMSNWHLLRDFSPHIWLNRVRPGGVWTVRFQFEVPWKMLPPRVDQFEFGFGRSCQGRREVSSGTQS